MQDSEIRTLPTSKLGSPHTSRELRSCLSFATIKQQRTLEQVQTPRTACKHALQDTYHKQKQNIRPEAYSNTKAHSNKLIMRNYQIQNQSLRETVNVLKEQIDALNCTCSRLKDSNARLEEHLQASEAKLRAARHELEVSRAKEDEYESIGQKIGELEELQDRMIEENGQLKHRDQLMKKLISQILVAAGASTNPTVTEIKNMVKTTLDQL